MPEPIQPTELPQPQRLTVGETPVYLKKPLEVGGQTVTEITIKGASRRKENGLESAVIIMEEKSRRRGEEGKPFTKILDNVNDMEEVDWDRVAGVTFTDEGGVKRHVLTKDQLSLTKPTSDKLNQSVSLDQTPVAPAPDLSSEALQTPQSPEPPSREAGSGSARQSPEPKLARSILETYSGEPTTLTIVGLKAYETRAHDLADKAMQLKTSLGERIWKQGIGPAYFHEQARQYYDQMLKAAQSPFAEQSIKIAEAAGKNRYQELLKNKNFLTRPTRQFIEWMKDTLGVQTLSQKFALEEIAHMRETGEIKERQAFDREAGAIRKRFEQDVDIQDQFIRGSLGEKLTILSATDVTYKPLVDVVKRLVKEYATGDIATKKDFDKLTDQLFQKHLKTARRDVFDQAELYTSSLFEVAENLRAKASHEGGLAAVDAQLESMQVRLGMGVMGEATALVPSDVEKGTKAVVRAVDWMEKKGIIGPFVFNEATVASAVALSLSLSFLPRMGLSTLANGVFTLGGGAAVGGLFAGLREYRNLEKEYLTHLRERESGLTFAPDAKRRAWMEKFMVDQRNADDLITGIRTPIYESDGKTLRAAITTDELRASMANLADAKARRALSGRTDSQRVGLIQFTGRDNIETQRTALDVTIAQAEKDLSTYLDAHPDSPAEASAKAGLPSLTDLTTAQTRIINEGMNKVEGLDDPIKVTLGLLDKYNPEADIMRRRFPLIGADQKTGAKAQGLEQIFAEFRRAARGAAIKKGLEVGVSGFIIGGVIRGVLEGGAQVGAEALKHTPPPGSPENWFATHDFQFSNNLHIDNTSGDLLDTQNHVVVEGIKKAMRDTNYFKNGVITDAGKKFILEQAQLHKVNLEIPDAVKSTWSFTNDHLVPLSGLKPGVDIQAPPELHWAVAADGAKNLVVDIKDAHGVIATQNVLWNSATDTGNPIDAVTRYGLLHYTPEQNISTTVPTERIFLPGVGPFPDAAGTIHNIQAMIPKDSMLAETGTLANGEHVYQLLDSNKQAILNNIHIDQYGQITNMADLKADADAANITFENPLDSTMKIPIGGSGGGMEKVIGDMGNEKGAHGIWGWVEDPMIADGNIKAITPGTNLAKNLFRGYEENVVMKANFILENGTKGVDMPYTAMHAGDKFIDLPKALFEDAQLVKLGKLMDEAIKIRETDGIPLADMDQLHRTVYEIGRIGRVATKDEVEYMIREMGGGEKTISIFTPVINQSVVQSIQGEITGTNTSIVTNIINLAERPATPDLSWIPPVPIIHRRPLETATGIQPPFEIRLPELPKGMYYSGETLENLQQWVKENPQLLRTYRKQQNPDGTVAWVDKEGHPIVRDVTRERTEIQTYLNEMQKKDTNYFAYLESLLATPSLTPMVEQTRVAVNIPAYLEGKNIYNTLEKYVKQIDANGEPLDPGLFEINIIVNRKTGSPADNTVEEIKRFIADSTTRGEHFHINYFDVTFDPPHNVVGNARRVLTDLTLMRSLARSHQPEPLYIESEDADLMLIDQHTIVNLIDKFDQNPHLDAAVGMQDRLPEVLMQNDYLFFTRRLEDIVGTIFERRQSLRPEENPYWHHWHNRNITGGWNTGYTAESYALIRGYDRERTMAEDTVIGERISMIRGDGRTPNLDVVGTLTTRSDSSPRRFIKQIVTGKSAYSESFVDEEVNRDIKTSTIDELMQRIAHVARINDENKHIFVSALAWKYDYIKTVVQDELRAKETYDMAMVFIGLKKEDYTYTADGKVQINSLDHLKDALDDYRVRHQAPRKPGERTKYRTSPETPAVVPTVDQVASEVQPSENAQPTISPPDVQEESALPPQPEPATSPEEVTPPITIPPQPTQP